MKRCLALLLLALGLVEFHGDWRIREREAETVDEPVAATSRSFGKGGAAAVARALAQLGSAPEEAASVGRAVERKLGKGWQGPFVVVAAADGGFHHVTAFRGKRRAIVGRGSPGVALVPVEERLLHADGAVSGGVGGSLASAGVPVELIPEFLDVFRWSVDLVADAQDGDKFRAVWTGRSAKGRAIGWRLEAARYDGAAGRLASILWDGDFFDERGRSVRREYLKAPVRYRAISSAFGKFRFSPFGKPWRLHKGTDFAAPVGTPIVSVADGRVAYAGRRGEYGNLVDVAHDGQRQTLYGHLSRYGPGIRRGAPVRQGQVLGYVGVTGNATGPHLHFELRKSGETENFRAAKLPSRTAPRATRPIKFRARWKELLGS